MLADQATRIAPRRAGFGAETGGQGGQSHGLGDLVLGQDLLAHKVGQGDFGGGDEPETTGQGIENLSKFRIRDFKDAFCCFLSLDQFLAVLRTAVPDAHEGVALDS